MLKSTWTRTALSVIVAAAGGGAYYYITHATIEQHVPASAAAAPPSVAPSAPRDEDAKRNTLEGIGSIKNLRPVPLQPVPQR